MGWTKNGESERAGQMTYIKNAYDKLGRMLAELVSNEVIYEVLLKL